MHEFLWRHAPRADVLQHHPPYAAVHIRIKYLRAGLSVLSRVETRLRPDLHKVREGPFVGVEGYVDVPKVYEREVRTELEGGERFPPEPTSAHSGVEPIV